MKRIIIAFIWGILQTSVWGQTQVPATDANSPIWYKDGNVGIGVELPGSKLDVNGIIRTFNKDNSSATWDNISLWSDGTKAHIQSNGDEDGFYIKSNGAGKIIFESKVGIGTSTTSEYLNIEGNLQFFGSGSTAHGIFFDHNYTTYPTATSKILFDFYGHNYGGTSLKHGMIYQSGRPGFAKHWFLDDTGNVQMLIDDDGNVAIGNADPKAKLDVSGDILAKEIRVEDVTADNIVVKTNGNTADFVFDKEYKLGKLNDIEKYISENKHLPGIPSAAQMEESGVNLAQMNKLLLQKIEELTLYVIDLKRDNQKMEADRGQEQEKCKMLEKRLAAIESLLSEKKQ